MILLLRFVYWGATYLHTLQSRSMWKTPSFLYTSLSLGLGDLVGNIGSIYWFLVPNPSSYYTHLRTTPHECKLRVVECFLVILSTVFKLKPPVTFLSIRMPFSASYLVFHSWCSMGTESYKQMGPLYLASLTFHMYFSCIYCASISSVLYIIFWMLTLGFLWPVCVRNGESEPFLNLNITKNP